MPMMASQILKFLDFTETQKSRYLENETLLFLKPKKKKIVNYTSETTLWQNIVFVAEVAFKERWIFSFQFFHNC